MPSRQRERELARLRHERRVARAASLRARRRRRARAALRVVAGLVAVALLAVGAVALGNRLDRDRQSQRVAQDVPCRFVRGGQAARDVGVPPVTGVLRQRGTATIKTDQGDLVVELLAAAAPCTVHSFRYLASRDYFDGTRCHRLTTGPSLYVLQCGDPTATGRGTPGYSFGDENLAAFGGRPGSRSPVTYPPGTVAMANAGPGTNGSQFFVVYRASRLDPAYTPFARVVAGLDVAQRIAASGVVSRGGDKPKRSLVIRDVALTPTFS